MTKVKIDLRNYRFVTALNVSTQTDADAKEILNVLNYCTSAKGIKHVAVKGDNGIYQVYEREESPVIVEAVEESGEQYIIKHTKKLKLGLSWISSDAAWYDINAVVINITPEIRKALQTAVIALKKHSGWNAIDIWYSEDTKVLKENNRINKEWFADNEYLKVHADGYITFYSSHKHNTDAQLNSDSFKIEDTLMGHVEEN